MSRVDEWTSPEDKFLAETIIKYVRNGKTQLQAFEDVGEQIDRSAKACGFRWNKVLRKQYTEELRIARKIRWHQKIDAPKFKIVEQEMIESVSPVEEKSISYVEALRKRADLEERKIEIRKELLEIEGEIRKLKFAFKQKSLVATNN